MGAPNLSILRVDQEEYQCSMQFLFSNLGTKLNESSSCILESSKRENHSKGISFQKYENGNSVFFVLGVMN